MGYPRHKRTFLLLVFALVLCPVFAQSQVLNSGTGLPYVRAAWLDEPGHVHVHAHSRVFTKPSIQIIKGLPQTVVYWDIQGALGLSYTTPVVELSFIPYIYQDTHKGRSGFNVPDDLFLSAKFGSQKRQDQPFNLAVAADFRVPLGRYHNLILEPYSAGTFEWGLTGIASYRPLLNNLPLDEAFHLSFGFTTYGDYGTVLTDASPFTDRNQVRSTTRSIELGFGASFRRDLVSYWVQFFGSHFLVQPPITAYGREDYFFFSPGLSYELRPGLTAEFALDVRLIGGFDETAYDQGVRRISALPNYPGWRFNVGLRAELPLPAWIPKPPSTNPTEEHGPVASGTPGFDKLQKKLDQALRELVNLRVEVDRLHSNIAELRERNLSNRVTALQNGLQADSAKGAKELSDNLVSSSLSPDIRYLVALHVALTNYRTGDYSRARAILRDLIRQDPENPHADDAAYWLGRTYESEGKLHEAISAYVRASNLPDGDQRPYAWINIAACLFRLGQYEKGKVILQELVKRYPHSRTKRVADSLLAKLEEIETHQE